MLHRWSPPPLIFCLTRPTPFQRTLFSDSELKVSMGPLIFSVPPGPGILDHSAGEREEDIVSTKSRVFPRRPRGRSSSSVLRGLRAVTCLSLQPAPFPAKMGRFKGRPSAARPHLHRAFGGIQDLPTPLDPGHQRAASGEGRPYLVTGALPRGPVRGVTAAGPSWPNVPGTLNRFHRHQPSGPGPTQPATLNVWGSANDNTGTIAVHQPGARRKSTLIHLVGPDYIVPIPIASVWNQEAGMFITSRVAPRDQGLHFWLETHVRFETVFLPWPTSDRPSPPARSNRRPGSTVQRDRKPRFTGDAARDDVGVPAAPSYIT